MSLTDNNDDNNTNTNNQGTNNGSDNNSTGSNNGTAGTNNQSQNSNNQSNNPRACEVDATVTTTSFARTSARALRAKWAAARKGVMTAKRAT